MHNPVLDDTPGSPLLAVEDLIRSLAPPRLVGLHRGKAYFPPCAQPHEWREGFGLAPEDHAPATGADALRAALSERLAQRRRAPVSPAQIIVTNGATHGVALAFHALLSPGDEVIVLSPQWLFATGLIRSAWGVPVEIPVFLELDRDPGFDLVGTVSRAVTNKTRAIYFNNLNNPTGGRLDAAAVRGLVEVAQRYKLWIVSDNAYENFDFTATGYPDIADVPGAEERTFSLYSFSKTFSMIGYRIGYLVCPPAMESALAKWALYSIDGVSVVAQLSAFEALKTPSQELENRRKAVKEAWELAHRELRIPHTNASGGLFTFLDLSSYAGGAVRFLERCVESGVSLAPGAAFGMHCAQYCRLCYTAAPAEQVCEAIHRINTVYAGGFDGR